MDGIGSLCGAILWASLCDANNDIGFRNKKISETKGPSFCLLIIKCQLGRWILGQRQGTEGDKIDGQWKVLKAAYEIR